jgi:hypothetical protein
MRTRGALVADEVVAAIAAGGGNAEACAFDLTDRAASHRECERC